MSSRLVYKRNNRPRPYSDITEVDPLATKFTKSIFWALHRGFRQVAWDTDPYTTSLEPELDWVQESEAKEKGLRLFH